MNKEDSSLQSSGMSRRDFIKAGTGGGILAGLLLSSQIVNPRKVSAKGLGTRQHAGIDSIINIKPDYKRFDQKHTAFNIGAWGDKNWSLNPVPGVAPIKYPDKGQDTMDENVVKFMTNGMTRNMSGGAFMTDEEKQRPGYTQLDFATTYGGAANIWKTGAQFAGFFSNESGPHIPMPTPDGGQKLLPTNAFAGQFPIPQIPKSQKWKFESKKDAVFAIKKMAKLYGAAGVGIAPYDERFIYKTEVFAPLNPQKMRAFPHLFKIDRQVDLEKSFGFKPKSVIVFLVEMDYENLKTTPSGLSKATTYHGYDEALTVGSRITRFLHELGYHARPSLNDTGLNIPLAISAGLGEGSRMGLLVSEEFGPRIRIGKVFTELELEYDKPITFGVKQFCEVCKKCCDSCPSGAISTLNLKDPLNKPINRSNNPGVEKWYNDGQKCLSFWSENHTACSNCITVCPYNKIDEWHHDLAQIATRIPGVRSMARYLDEAFGYGKINTGKYSKNYWKKSI